MSAHTPGPWEWRENLSGKTLESAHETVIDSAPYEGMWFTGESEEANQRLVAAAPELLESLEMLLNRRMDVAKQLGVSEASANGSDGRYARARAAIEKARGKV